MLDLLAEHGVTALDGVVLDLGVSSFQLDDPARGFSFRGDGPLDMRMSRSGPTAADLVNTLPERELADLLFEFGEERASRRIARAIVAARAPRRRITTTARLAAIIRGVLPPDRSGIDPATRSFQALRIRVNDELGEIERALDAGGRLLAARRAAGRRVVPFAGGPHRQALHGRGGRPGAGAVAPRSARPCRASRAALPPADRPAAASRRRRRPAPIRAPAAPGCARSNARLPRSRAMIRPITCVCFLLACGSGLYLYQSKHRVQLLDRRDREDRARHRRTARADAGCCTPSGRC